MDDIQSVKDSISEAVNEIEDLPEDANDPRVIDRTSTEWPILTIVIGGDSISIETAKALAVSILILSPPITIVRIGHSVLVLSITRGSLASSGKSSISLTASEILSFTD